MPARLGNFLIFVPIIFIISACSDVDESNEVDKLSSLDNVIQERKIKSRPLPNPIKNAYFGDLHVHTENSFDAYTFGTISTPADAYRYAQGQAIPHPTGYEIQLSRPLDFYAVTDHAMFLGLLKEAADTSSEFSRYDLAKPLHNLNDSVNGGILSIIKRSGLFRPFGRAVNEGLKEGTIEKSLVEEVSRTVWQETIKAADDAYAPGVFTTFAGYEYTSSIDLYEKYLHRNVIFRETKTLSFLSLFNCKKDVIQIIELGHSQLIFRSIYDFSSHLSSDYISYKVIGHCPLHCFLRWQQLRYDRTEGSAYYRT